MQTRSFLQEDDDFLSGTTSDQQGLAQEQSTKNTGIAALVPDDEVTFDANKVSLQVPDRLFGPSFTAVNGISQAIGTVIQVHDQIVIHLTRLRLFIKHTRFSF